MTDLSPRWDWSLDPNDEPLARIRPHAMTPLGQAQQAGKAGEVATGQENAATGPEMTSGDEKVDEAWKRIAEAIAEMNARDKETD